MVDEQPRDYGIDASAASRRSAPMSVEALPRRVGDCEVGSDRARVGRALRRFLRRHRADTLVTSALSGSRSFAPSRTEARPQSRKRVGSWVGSTRWSQGNSVEGPTTEGVQKAVDLVKEQKDKGQIRRFTGNDYADDLAAGNIAIAQAYSGDVIQLQADNPDLQFIIPESGGDWFIDTMVIPPPRRTRPRPRSGSTTSTTAPTTPSWWPSSSTCRCCRI